MSEKAITTIDQLKQYNEGEVVNLPPFSPDKPFVAKLKRPSLLVMAKIGKIPNTLLPQANEIFFGSKSNKLDSESLAKTFDIIEVMCEAAFVEPSYKEIKDSGIQLTDQQYLAVFNYTQQGAAALASFREK